MSEIKIAFYKGDGILRDKFIRWWTKSPYSHVEIIMPDGTMAGIMPPDYPVVRRKTSLDLDPKEWELINIPVSKEQLTTIDAFIDSTIGQGYDWFGMILSHITPFKVRVPNKWYCSEWVFYALSVAQVFSWQELKPYDVSRIPPEKLYSLIKNGVLK